MKGRKNDDGIGIRFNEEKKKRKGDRAGRKDTKREWEDDGVGIKKGGSTGGG